MSKKTLIVYAYAKCTTCKRARQFLEKHHVAYHYLPIETQAPSRRELTLMLQYLDGNVRKLFNTSGMLYRSMQLASKIDSLSQKEALDLLGSNGMLVKRPFVLSQDSGAVGFKEDVWLKKFVQHEA